MGMRLGWVRTKPTDLQDAKGRGVRLGKRLLRRSLCGRPMTQGRLLLDFTLVFQVHDALLEPWCGVPPVLTWLRFVLPRHAGVAHADITSGPERDELVPGDLRRCPGCASNMG